MERAKNEAFTGSLTTATKIAGELTGVAAKASSAGRLSNTFSNTMSALKIATFAKATESIEMKPVQPAQTKAKDAAVEEEEEVLQ